ncbi:putative protein N(5)-glutamine methyltransferase [Sanguibacter sp. 25GB23B1]|uniref:putative protein N(5)-glutamine methyltransferase n=1 Tax=unclassified Sanguibacter TaxID=2645534 RepID=UPI0032AF95A5
MAPRRSTATRPDPVLVGAVTALRAAGSVFAEDEAAMLLAEARSASHLAEMIERRTSGAPLEQVLGWAELRGVRVAVVPGVFVPRRRSELLVDEAVALLGARSLPVVVDLCCGTGAVGAAVAAVRDVELYAADVDPVAVACARHTVRPADRVFLGDLFDALPDALRGRVDVLVANAPYVPTGEIRLLPAEARDHEPHRALDGGADGLDMHRRVAQGAREWLAPGGRLLVETSERQAPGTVSIVRQAGLVPRVVRREEADATVVVGSLPGS